MADARRNIDNGGSQRTDGIANHHLSRVNACRFRNCAGCAYATPLETGERTVLVCANCPLMPVRLMCVEPDRPACHNFVKLRARSGKPTLPVPPPGVDDACYIPLTQGLYAAVDPEDYEWASRFQWYAQGSGGNPPYACRATEHGGHLFLHKAIMDPPPGYVVDHIDRNRLNDRRSNLRICTPQQNTFNRPPQHSKKSSSYKGVYRRGRGLKQWFSLIQAEGIKYSLGYFESEIEAALAYDRAARRLHGEFAYLNLPAVVDRGEPEN